MSSIVTITTPDTPVSCPAGEQQKLRFQVSGKQARRISIGATIVTHGLLQSSWLRLDQTEMDRLDPGEIWDIVVTITVPSDVSAEEHAFSLMIYDVREPGEHFDESAAITLNIQAAVVEEPVAPPPPPAPDRHRNFFVVFLAVLTSVAASILLGWASAVAYANSAGGGVGFIYFLVIFLLGITVTIIATRNRYPWWFCLLCIVLPGALFFVFAISFLIGSVINIAGYIGFGILFSRYSKRAAA